MFKKKKQTQTSRTTQPLPPAAVFSYYGNRSPGANDRQMNAPKDKSGHRWLLLTPSIVAALAILVCIVYATSLSTQPRIQINDSNGNQLLRTTEFYQLASAKLMKRSIFNRSKLTIDTNKLAKELTTAYPELGNVSVIIPLISRRPVIEVQPAQAILQLRGHSGNFIVDNQGKAIVKAEEITSSLRDSLPIVNDQSGLEVQINKQVLPHNTVDFIAEVTGQHDAKKIQIQDMTLPAIPNEIHVRLKGQTYYIKFDLQGSAREETGTLLAVKEKFEKDGTVPSEYVDVRVPEKVFYK